MSWLEKASYAGSQVPYRLRLVAGLKPKGESGGPLNHGKEGFAHQQQSSLGMPYFLQARITPFINLVYMVSYYQIRLLLHSELETQEIKDFHVNGLDLKAAKLVARRVTTTRADFLNKHGFAAQVMPPEIEELQIALDLGR